MKVTKENVEQLINRFMEGETCNEEEAALYKFFQEETVPDRLKVYKPMFAYFAGGMKDEDLPASHDSAKIVNIDSAPRKNTNVFNRWSKFILPLVVGLAACFTGVTFLVHYEQQQTLYNSYSGSYIIDHGKRLSNIRDIMPKLKVVEAHADEADSRHQTEQITRNVLNEIADPAVRAAAAEALK